MGGSLLVDHCSRRRKLWARARCAWYESAGQARGDGGEFLMGQLAGVIDGDGAAIGVNFFDWVFFGVGGGEEGEVEGFPDEHGLGIGLVSAGARAGGEFIAVVEKSLRRQEFFE